MSGVTVLYEYIAAPMNGIHWIIICAILTIIIAVYGVHNNHEPVAGVCAIGLSVLFGYFLYQTMPSTKCVNLTVDDTALFNQVMSQYDFRERKGDLWIMEVIEKKE